MNAAVGDCVCSQWQRIKKKNKRENVTMRLGLRLSDKSASSASGPLAGSGEQKGLRCYSSQRTTLQASEAEIQTETDRERTAIWTPAISRRIRRAEVRLPARPSSRSSWKVRSLNLSLKQRVRMLT